MKLDKKLAYAIFNLGIYFIAHIIKRSIQLFLKPKKSGYEKFFENYKEDNILSLTFEERANYNQFEKCINCNLCIDSCQVVKNLGKDKFPGPALISNTLSRNLADLWTSSQVINLCLRCKGCENVCPTNVPVTKIASFINSKIYKIKPYSLIDTKFYENLESYGNIYGEEKKLFPLIKKEKAEYVYFAGCVARYKNKEEIEDTTFLLEKLKIRYTMIDEVCCGGFDYKMGFPKKEELRKKNLEKILATGTNKVITSCPLCYRTFTEDPLYKDKIEVKHVIDFVYNIPIDKKGVKVTFQIPCDLRNSNKVTLFEEIVLKNPHIVNLIESFEGVTNCCGIGATQRGIVTELSNMLSYEILESALETKSDLIITACPACIIGLKGVMDNTKKIRIESLSKFFYSLSIIFPKVD